MIASRHYLIKAGFIMLIQAVFSEKIPVTTSLLRFRRFEAWSNSTNLSYPLSSSYETTVEKSARISFNPDSLPVVPSGNKSASLIIASSSSVITNTPGHSSTITTDKVLAIPAPKLGSSSNKITLSAATNDAKSKDTSSLHAASSDRSWVGLVLLSIIRNAQHRSTVSTPASTYAPPTPAPTPPTSPASTRALSIFWHARTYLQDPARFSWVFFTTPPGKPIDSCRAPALDFDLYNNRPPWPEGDFILSLYEEENCKYTGNATGPGTLKCPSMEKEVVCVEDSDEGVRGKLEACTKPDQAVEWYRRTVFCQW